jgi:hypothetical protein
MTSGTYVAMSTRSMRKEFGDPDLVDVVERAGDGAR